MNMRILRGLCCGMFATLMFGFAGPAAPAHAEGAQWQSLVEQSWLTEYAEVDKAIQGHNQMKPGTSPSIYDEQALLLKTDKSPADVALRRADALAASIAALPHAPKMDDSLKELNALRQRRQGAADPEATKTLYMDIRRLTRRLALANPLVDFDSLVLVATMKPGGDYHMVDQYVGWNAKPGGGLYIVRNIKTRPQIVDLLANSTVRDGRLKGKKLEGGAYLSPDLSFEGKKIAFAWNEPSAQCYRIFTVNVDGSDLVQLSDGPANRNQLATIDSGHNDFDPCWMPDGRIAFLSDRRGGYGRCHGRPLMSYCLYSMRDDGSDMIPLSYHETNEWNPSIDNDGKLVYTRWDYVDRDDCIAHHLWTCFPDGRDPRAPHGNYPLPLDYTQKTTVDDGRKLRPNGEWSIRAIPGKPQCYIATAAGHHTHSLGELVLIDTSIPDDGKMSQVKGITIAQERWPDRDGPYATAWPLNSDYYICHYKGDVILLDRFGNKELLCARSEFPGNPDRLLDPTPLKPRPAPPVIPPATFQGERASAAAPRATISIMNVYNADMPLPPEVKVKWLRVIQVLPQLTPRINSPRMGYASESLARIPLGIVPVEEDGSVYFRAPVGKELYFQLLDERGLAVRSMRSGTYVHAGEQMSCLGCHESRSTPAGYSKAPPLATRRAPSTPQPEVTDGAIPFNWHRLAKPVLQAKCADCHAKEKKGPDMSYDSLRPYAFFMPFGLNGYTNGDIKASGSRSVPMKTGAMASRLLKYLDKSHYDVQLTPEEFRRVTLWLDCNSNELGAYVDIDKQRAGQIVWPRIDCDPADPLGLEK